HVHHKHIHTGTHTHTLTHSHAHVHHAPHTHTHTHTHTPTLTPFLSLSLSLSLSPSALSYYRNLQTRMGQASGGLMKRAPAAACFMFMSEVEPTTGVDSQWPPQVWGLIRESRGVRGR